MCGELHRGRVHLSGGVKDWRMTLSTFNSMNVEELLLEQHTYYRNSTHFDLVSLLRQSK